MPIVDFSERVLNVAERLSLGEAEGTVLETYLLMSGLASSIASFVWPQSLNGDRKRFVEAWVQMADPSLRPALISLPLLYASLRAQRKHTEADALLKEKPELRPSSMLVLRSRDVDLEEAKVMAICSGLTRKEVRRHSYPVVFYEHVRCRLVHEYEFGDTASPWAIAIGVTEVSYVNVEASGGTRSRRIHFDVSWLRRLLSSMASAAAARPIPSPQPNTWWVDG
jgi:hypothetical protein